jgi:hypothetical protein
MKKRKIIDISTEEKKKEVFDRFNSFTSKNQAHEYFGISDNKQGSEYLREIASSVGFDLTLYKEKKKKPTRYCKECGKEIISKWAKDFCCSACAAKYNNRHRDKSVYEKVASKLKKEKIIKPIISALKTQKKHKQVCEFCGKEFENRNKKSKFCSVQCQANYTHKKSYEDFLSNNEKYCRGNYTPKAFKNEFLKEQNGICAICGCKPEHNGKPLVFILDHIDGDASNNKRENLRMICPNCDSQLDTFKSKNKNSTRRNYWKEHILFNLQK